MSKFLLRRLANYLVLVAVATSLAYLLAASTLDPCANFEWRSPPPPEAVVDRRLDELNLNDKTKLTERYRWGEPAKLDRIVVRALEVDAAINAFANGEVDYADVGPDPSVYKRARGVQGGAVHEAAGPDFRHFTINGSSPNLSDVNVRKAVGLAINREALTRADLTGQNWPAQVMDNHFFVNTQEGYQDNAGELGKYDPDKAKELLDQAGWKMNGAYRAKGGKTRPQIVATKANLANAGAFGFQTPVYADIGYKK